MTTIQPGKRTGSVTIPRSKSHEHRLLVADFLAGDYSRLAPAEGDSEDIIATKRCLEALLLDDIVAPAARLRTGSGVRGSSREIIGKKASSGIGNTHRSMYETLQFQIRRKF